MRRFLPLLLLAISLNTFAKDAETILIGADAAKVIPESNMIRYKSFTSVPAYIQFRASDRIEFSQWQTWMTNHYFKGNKAISFQLIGSELDELGMTHFRFQQMADGIPLVNGIWIVHTINQQVVSMNGDLFDSVPKFNAGLSETAALAAALSEIGAESYKWESASEEAHLKVEQNDPEATFYPKGQLVIVNRDPSLNDVNLTLAWMFDIYASEPMSRREIYIDANQGFVAFENDLIHHADSNGVAVTGYSGSQNIVADYTGSQFRLRETGRGNGIETYDLNNATGYGGASDYFDADNYWSTTSIEQYGTDAHWGAEMTYDYYYNNFNRNSIDNNGFKLLSYAHYGTNYGNAFWDGQRMTYGDGSNGTSPFTAIDITGHEVTHGLTSFTADLVYSYESGALNESFSDIFGAAVEFDALGFSNGDWLMGEDLGFVIRNMANPNSYGDPDTYYGTNWATGAGDNGGVHTNSGVQNFWFYLLTVGGTGTNDNGDSYNVSALGIDDAQAIAFRNLTVYLSVNSQYADARFYAIISAQDLYGVCTQEVESTTNAWYAVGVGNPYVAGVTSDFLADDTEDCSVPFTVNFSNLSSNTDTYAWNFGDGQTSTLAQPSHTYTAAGTYTVTLQASSSCGTDTKVETSYIAAGPDVPCDYILPESGQGITQQGCLGYLFDNGGADGNYLPNTDSWVTIAPCGASTVTITFEDFALESANGCIYDYLEVYDGSSINDPVIGTYCGSNLPPNTLTSTGPAITVRLYADGGLEYSGFKISWECEEGNTPPAPAFNASITESCDGMIHFVNESSNCPDTWLWRFGDGVTSTDLDPTHEYVTNGTYNVTLIVSNANGSDSLTKTAYINVNRPLSPTGPTVEVCPEEAATLLALPAAAGETRWYDNLNATTPIHVGDTFVTPVLTYSTAYFAETVVEGLALNVGPADTSIGGGGMFNFNQSLLFDVYAPVTLKSARVFANSASDRTIELRDENGSVLESATVSIPAGESEVSLNFALPIGTDLQLGLSVFSNVDLFRNNDGVAYPYNDASNYVSITHSSANQNGGLNHYYYFYDWKIGEADCTSPRHTIWASTGECTGIDELAANHISIYPNPNNGSFTMSWETIHVDQIFILNMQGQMIKSIRPQSEMSQLDLSLSSGMYMIQFQTNDQTIVKNVIVQ